MQKHASEESIAREGCERSKPIEVTASHAHRRFDLHANQRAGARLQHEVDLLAAPGAEVGKVGTDLAPANLLAQLHRYVGLQQRATVVGLGGDSVTVEAEDVGR